MTKKEEPWGKLPPVMGAWGEVGISLAHANRAARIAEHDLSPSMQRRIRKNLLLEQVEEHHANAKRLEREAGSLRKQASSKEKAAERKLRAAASSSTGLTEKKAARLQSEAESLAKQASVLLKDAEKRSGEALKSRKEEEKAQREILQLDRPGEDITMHMDDHEFD